MTNLWPQKTSTLSLVAGLILGLVSNAAVADTFSWVDANGVINYSERMPRGVPADKVTRIKDNASAPSSTPGDPVTYTPSNNSNQPNTARGANQEGLSERQQQMLAQLQTAEQERQAMVEEVRRDNCERAQRVLRNLSSVGRVRVRAEDGTRSVMAEEERQKRIAEAQEGVATNC